MLAATCDVIEQLDVAHKTNLMHSHIRLVKRIVAGVESPITQREVEHALRGMPMNKSPCPDNITTEMIVAAGDIGITELTKLDNMMYVQENFPSDLNESIFIVLPKVNGTLKCGKTPYNDVDESCDKVSASHFNQQN